MLVYLKFILVQEFKHCSVILHVCSENLYSKLCVCIEVIRMTYSTGIQVSVPWTTLQNISK